MTSSPSEQEAEARKWLYRLNEALVLRWARVRRFQEYYEGKHRLLFAGEKFKSTFGKLFSEYADNFCDLVVDVQVARLTVQGFRMEPKTRGDNDAWSMWQWNCLDAGSELIHTEAMICEESYALVEPSPDDPWPTIHIEHPSQVIVAMEPGNPRLRAAALKRWVDDDGNLRANVYLPDAVFKYTTKGDGQIFQGWVLAGSTSPAAVQLQWEPFTIGGEVQHAANPLGVVPIVPFRNKPRMVTTATSELRSVVPIQDAINKLVLDMLVAAESAAIPARWAAGLPLKTDPKTNEILPTPDILALTGKLFQSEDPAARFGVFPAADLANFVKAIEMKVQHLAWQRHIPQHYLSQSGQAPSGDSIKSSEVGLVSDVKQKARHFGESHEEVIRLGFLAMGDPRATSYNAETIWADPEFHSEAERIDALLKQKAFGLPDEVLWAKAGYSPQEIEEIRALQAEEKTRARADALADAKLAAEIAAIAGPAPAPAGGPGEVVLSTPTVKKAPVMVEP